MKIQSMKNITQYIREQRIDELSSELLKRATLKAKSNAGKVDVRTKRFEKAALDALKREIEQVEIDTTDMPTPKNNQKYELYQKEGKLWRIRALKDIKLSDGCIIKGGTLGGLIEFEKNLSQEGTCWLFEDAKAYDNARIYDTALVFNNAKVYGNAQVYGDAKVYGNARIFQNASVYERAEVLDDAVVTGRAKVHGNAIVFEDTVVDDDKDLTV